MIAGNPMIPDGDPTTLTEAAHLLRAGRVTAVQLTELALRRSVALQSTLGAFTTITADRAMAAARRADAELAGGIDRGPLHGLPIAVKDMFATADAPTSANSRAFRAPWPADYDAPAVGRLRSAGTVLIGKTTAGEFGCGEPQPGSGFPFPRNPWNVGHTPAGSSSGSAIAVAAGMAWGALGGDTGGSVRGPAAVNGITGLCATLGAIPTEGAVALSWSMDAAGVLGRSAADCLALWRALSTDRHRADPDTVTTVGLGEQRMDSPATVRLGVAEAYFLDDPDLQPEVLSGIRDAIEVFRGLGADIADVRVRWPHEAKQAATVITLAEGFHRHRRNLSDRWSEYGTAARSFLARGAFLTAADYLDAQRFRRQFSDEMAAVFRTVDALVVPSMKTEAARIDRTDLEDRFRGRNCTRQWNLAGLPSLSVPCGFGPGGLPIAFQLVGPPNSDEYLLRLAEAYQTRTSWHLCRPPVMSTA